MLKWQNKKIAIWGWGKEGIATANFLHKNQIPFSVINDSFLNQEIIDSIYKKYNAPVTTNFADEYLLNFDIIIKSPGVSLYSDKIVMAIKHGVVFTSGTNLWFYIHRKQKAKIITVTGTKGKSTTTSLIAHLLQEIGYRVVLAGNIGKPLLSFYNKKNVDFWIIELSSYQIADIQYSGQVNVFLNLFPEHLDWHQNLSQYYQDKLNLIRKAKSKYVIINNNEANPYLNKAVKRKKYVVLFNHPKKVHVHKNFIYDDQKALLSIAQSPLMGIHNQHNICAALTAIKTFEISLTKVTPHIKTFQILPHRLNIIATHNFITYVNDSISTTPESTIAAIKTFPNYKITLLLGGMDRCLDWKKFAQCLTKLPVSNIILMHQSGKKIYNFLQEYNYSNCHYVNNLKEAVTLATQITSPKSIILLSPASPSYGAFGNFMERGNYFKKQVFAIIANDS